MAYPALLYSCTSIACRTPVLDTPTYEHSCDIQCLCSVHRPEINFNTIGLNKKNVKSTTDFIFAAHNYFCSTCVFFTKKVNFGNLSSKEKK